MNWIESHKKKPEAFTPVLVAVKGQYKYHVLRAVWLPEFYMKDPNDAFIGKNDYSEEEDMYYFPKGWYEYNNSDDMLYQINDPVLFWMPMPELPKF